LISGSTIAILMLLSSLNSSINPYICLFFNRNLIKSVKDLCCSRNHSHEDINPINDTNGVYYYFDTKFSSSQTEDTTTSLRHSSYYCRSANSLNSAHSRRSPIQLRSALYRNSLLNSHDSHVLWERRSVASLNDTSLKKMCETTNDLWYNTFLIS
jgi:hypothetical protein